MDVDGQRTLVLGANGVLGSLICERLATRGAIVLGTARTEASASNLPDGVAERLIVDLEDNASIAALISGFRESGQPFDAVVNAAGLVAFGAVDATPPAVAERLMRVNHLGPAAVISGILPMLRDAAEAGRNPYIVSIPGVVAERAFPNMAAYVASKSAHNAWLGALRMELRRPLVRVISARPGHTETGLAGRAVSGAAPAFPAGMAPAHVVDVITAAIDSDVNDLPSTAFA